VVFRIDYRGHDRSEGEATGAYGSPDYTIDVLNAVASIKRHPQVNPEKIGMWGHSMGGYLTLRSMVITDDVKAGVIWAGVVASYPDLIYNWRRTGSFTPSPSSRGRGWRTRWIEQYGTPEQNPDFWAAVSSNTYVSDLSGPLQLHHGTNDEDVPVAFSVRLAEEVRAVGGIADLYTYEGDNHNISNYFTTAMDRTIAFYDQNLK
jgi:dipeptidyl aminopeptidase/acylaminoacyl peptidase